MLSVERTSFFHDESSRRTLAFHESAPHRDEDGHFNCGCTQHVSDRPDGEPFQVQTSVMWRDKVGGVEAEYDIAKGFYTLRWEEPGAGRGNRPHLYLWWTSSECCKVEMCVPGVSFPGVDAILTTVILGRTDRKLFNGMEKSRLPAVTSMDDGAIWMHNFPGSPERIHVLENPLLLTRFRMLQWLNLQNAFDASRLISEGFFTDVNDLLEQASALTVLRGRLEAADGVVRDIRGCLPQSEMRQVVDVWHKEFLESTNR